MAISEETILPPHLTLLKHFCPCGRFLADESELRVWDVASYMKILQI